jgi:regulator of nucleoside diphosphate kinase
MSENNNSDDSAFSFFSAAKSGARLRFFEFASLPVRKLQNRLAYTPTAQTSQNESTMSIPVVDQPILTISARDYEKLERIAMAGMRAGRSQPIAEVLADKLGRAAVVPPQDVGEAVVTMYSDLTFCDDATKALQRVTLVYTGEEDIALGRISVLTPVGTALIGVSEGQSIGWHTAAGEPRRLTVIKVHSQKSESITPVTSGSR